MRIRLIAIGKKMPDWLQTGIHHYQKQLPKTLNFELISIEGQQRQGKSPQKTKQLEGELLIKTTKNADLIIAFDEKGKQHSTQTIAKNLQNWQQNNTNVALLIGGANGLSDECKQQTQQLWGLSNLTLPHAFARLLAVEQIYRAISIINNHPYHRE